MAQARDVVRRARGPGVRRKKGIIAQFQADPPEGSVDLCVDEMGTESAESFAGRERTRFTPTGHRPAERACQEIDYGRHGKGYVFGAFRPATGEAPTPCYSCRTTAS